MQICCLAPYRSEWMQIACVGPEEALTFIGDRVAAKRWKATEQGAYKKEIIVGTIVQYDEEQQEWLIQFDGEEAETDWCSYTRLSRAMNLFKNSNIDGEES